MASPFALLGLLVWLCCRARPGLPRRLAIASVGLLWLLLTSWAGLAFWGRTSGMGGPPAAHGTAAIVAVSTPTGFRWDPDLSTITRCALEARWGPPRQIRDGFADGHVETDYPVGYLGCTVSFVPSEPRKLARIGSVRMSIPTRRGVPLVTLRHGVTCATPEDALHATHLRPTSVSPPPLEPLQTRVLESPTRVDFAWSNMEFGRVSVLRPRGSGPWQEVLVTTRNGTADRPPKGPGELGSLAQGAAPGAAGGVVQMPKGRAIEDPGLPEPLVTISGEHVGLALMESRYAKFVSQEETLAWLDATYDAMADLTGGVPYEGRPILLREAPESSWWACAGETIRLNTRYVDTTLRDCDAGLVCFGWTHEMGHDFDVLGRWYIWDAPSDEWQANLKLQYAFEHLPDAWIRWSHADKEYPWHSAGTVIAAREYGDRFFAFFGDSYLADPGRPWTSMRSDEIHSFALRLARVYGWGVWKAWYRDYARLEASGMQPPETPKGKVDLMAALLAKETGGDVVPAFQRWRFPVTDASVREAAERYGLQRMRQGR
jgi:hypothetical protein